MRAPYIASMLFLEPALYAGSLDCILYPTLGHEVQTLLLMSSPVRVLPMPSPVRVLMRCSAGLCADSASLTRRLCWRRIKAKQDKEAGIAAQQAEKDAKKKKDKKK